MFNILIITFILRIVRKDNTLEKDEVSHKNISFCNIF